MAKYINYSGSSKVIKRLCEAVNDLIDGGGGGGGGTSNYDQLSNKPKINDVTLTGNKTLSALGIATKTSDLTNDSGFISDNNYVHTDNNYTTTEKNKLAGLENYTLPNASASTLGGIKVGNNLSIDENGVLNATGGGSGSSVVVTPIQTTGTKIATIQVDDVSTDLYAPSGGGDEPRLNRTLKIYAVNNELHITGVTS